MSEIQKDEPLIMSKFKNTSILSSKNLNDLLFRASMLS